MSSRNMRLLPQERKEAAQIYAVLSASISRLKLHENSPKVFENQCTEALNAVPSIQVEYVSCCDAATLQPLEEFNTSRPARVFAAVQCGKVRLIDNLPLF
jgi:pantoate--beta-alanine ligase